MDLHAVEILDLAQGIAETQQHEFASPRSRRLDIVILHVKMKQIFTEAGRQA